MSRTPLLGVAAAFLLLPSMAAAQEIDVLDLAMRLPDKPAGLRQVLDQLANRTEPSSLEGTTWVGDVEGKPYHYRFEKGNVLSYDLADGGIGKIRWRQAGDRVIFVTDIGDMECVIRGDLITGKGRTTTGHDWTWDLTRAK